MKITILFLSLVLVGCGFHPSQVDIKKANGICMNKGGVVSLNIESIYISQDPERIVLCGNDNSYNLKGTKK